MAIDDEEFACQVAFGAEAVKALSVVDRIELDDSCQFTFPHDILHGTGDLDVCRCLLRIAFLRAGLATEDDEYNQNEREMLHNQTVTASITASAIYTYP